MVTEKPMGSELDNNVINNNVIYLSVRIKMFKIIVSHISEDRRIEFNFVAPIEAKCHLMPCSHIYSIDTEGFAHIFRECTTILNELERNANVLKFPRRNI